MSNLSDVLFVEATLKLGELLSFLYDTDWTVPEALQKKYGTGRSYIEVWSLSDKEIITGPYSLEQINQIMGIITQYHGNITSLLGVASCVVQIQSPKGLNFGSPKKNTKKRPGG